MYPVGNSKKNLTIIGFDLRREDWQNHLIALCNCGQLFKLSLVDFESDKENPCKCGGKEIEYKKYNSWTVIGIGEYKGSNKYYPCKCECGTERWVAASSLKQNKSRSCGCKSEETEVNIETGKRGRRTKPPEPDVTGLMKQGEAAISMLNGIRMMRHDPDFRLMMLQMFNMVISPDGSEPDYKLEKEV